MLSGDDGITLPLMALGGRGLISVASNEIPAEMTRLVQLGLAGDFAAARAIQRRYFRLMEVNFVETNPTPVKAAHGADGPAASRVCRLPMVQPKPENLAKIRGVLESLGHGPAGLCCTLKSKRLFDENPAQLHRRAAAAFSSNSRTR